MFAKKGAFAKALMDEAVAASTRRGLEKMRAKIVVVTEAQRMMAVTDVASRMDLIRMDWRSGSARHVRSMGRAADPAGDERVEAWIQDWMESLRKVKLFWWSWQRSLRYWLKFGRGWSLFLRAEESHCRESKMMSWFD